VQRADLHFFWARLKKSSQKKVFVENPQFASVDDFLKITANAQSAIKLAESWKAS